MKLIFVAVLAALVVSEVCSDGFTLMDAAHYKNILQENAYLVTNKELIRKPVCDFIEDEWVQLKDFIVEYAVESGDINNKTGTVDFPTMRKLRSKKEMDMILASVCDEEHDMQDNMPDKIFYIFKSIIKRVGRCSDVRYLTAEESCKREILGRNLF